jgi:hypothetical protein
MPSEASLLSRRPPFAEPADAADGHARIQALREFEMLLPYVSVEDLEIVLSMMRRLAGQR